MALVLALVKGNKNLDGAYVAPENVDLANVIKGQDANHVELDGLQAGDSVVAGQYFVGKFNEVENKFVSDLKPVPAFTVAGQATVDDVKVDQADGKTTVSAE